MKRKRIVGWVSLGLATLAGSAVLELPIFVKRAEAIIGRPLTPMSYAGVARRTTRRAAYVGAAYHPYYW